MVVQVVMSDNFADFTQFESEKGDYHLRIRKFAFGPSARLFCRCRELLLPALRVEAQRDAAPCANGWSGPTISRMVTWIGPVLHCIRGCQGRNQTMLACGSHRIDSSSDNFSLSFALSLMPTSLIKAAE